MANPIKRADHAVFVFFDKLWMKYLRHVEKRYALSGVMALILIEAGLLMWVSRQVDNAWAMFFGFITMLLLLPRFGFLLIWHRTIPALDMDGWEISWTKHTPAYFVMGMCFLLANAILWQWLYVPIMLLYDSIIATALAFIYLRRVYDLEKCPVVACSVGVSVPPGGTGGTGGTDGNAYS